VRLSAFHVDGFGALADIGLEEMAPGLVVILGPNEAGKSTLFDFLAGVLFGFPARKGNARYHAPARGGRHGGRVGFVDEAGGAWVVARHAGAQRGLEIRLPDGSSGDEASLCRALSGASLSLFRAVFAVDLDDLGRIDNLGSDEVRELLFAASIFGQRRSATAAMKHLNEARDELGRPRRDAATANRLAGELEVVRSNLADARQEAATYEGLRLRAAQAKAQMDSQRSQLKSLRDRERELQLLETCWQYHCDARQALEELAAAPVTVTATTLIEHEGELRLLAAELSGHLERGSRLEDLRKSQSSQDASVDKRLSRLGAGWTRERALDTPEPELLLDSVRAARDRLASLRTGVASSQAVLSQAQLLLAACDRPDDPTETPREAPDRAGLELVTEALAELRTRVDEAERLELEILADERGRGLPLRAPESANPARRPAVMLLSAFAATSVLGVALFVRGQVALGATALALGIALGIAASVTWRAEARRASQTPGPIAAGDDASREPAGDRATLLARTRVRIGELAKQLGLEVPPLRVDIERCASMVQRQHDTRRRLDDAATARAEAEARVARAAEAERAARRALQLEEHDHETWCERHGFAPGNPEVTLEAVAALTEIRELLGAHGRVGRAIEALEPSVVSFARRFRALLASVEPSLLRFEPDDRRLATGPGVLGERSPVVVRGAREAETAADRDLGFAGGARNAGELGEVLADLVSRLEEATALHARRAALSKAHATAQIALEHVLGDGNASERLRAELAHGDVLQWASERGDLEPSIEELRRTEEDAVRQHQSLAEAMERLATSSRIAELEGRQGALEVELDRALRQYLVLGTARALLQRTLARHERDRQPAVIANAAAHFERVTAGRYTGLLAGAGSDGKRTVRVLSNTGEAIDAADLSRGTVEQLYLCLRLGLADSFAQRSVSLPIVLDDVLVNFDPHRARAVADELVAAVRTHQLVFLTCHPHLAELMLRAAADSSTESQLIELGESDPQSEQAALPLLTALPPLSA
jgi:uncharacterized protein YhaN